MDLINNDKLPLAYDPTNYDEVIVIVKHTAKVRETQAAFVRHDKSKDRYYLKGKLVRLKFSRMAHYSYPLPDSIALVPSEHVFAYTKEKREEKKREYIVTIFYGDILFLTLNFDSLDWMK